MKDILLQHREGPLLILSLNDPERANPLSPELAEELTRAFEESAQDEQLRALIIEGAGKHFSAGADLCALESIARGGNETENLEDSRRLERLFVALLGHPKLTIAAVSGAAIAGGCGLASACDFVVAEEKSRFSYTEVRIGFIPALVSTFLARRVGQRNLRRLLLNPKMLSAQEAMQIGLADEVVEDGSSLNRARELALEISHKASPAAFAATKQLLNDTIGLEWREALSHAAEANVDQRRHPECLEGVGYFLKHKKTPDWLDEDR